MIDYQVRIKRFSIRNYRKFKVLDVDFDGVSIATLAGRNSVGKTSILEALNLAFSDNISNFTAIKESDFFNEEPIELIVELEDPFFFEFQYPVGGQYGLIPCSYFTKTIERRRKKERGKFFSSEYDVKFLPRIEEYKPSNEKFWELKEKIKVAKPNLRNLVREFIISEDGLEYKLQSDLKSSGYRKFETTEGAQYDLDAFKYSQFDKVLFPKVFYFDCNRSRELLPQYNTAFSNVVTELNWKFKHEFLKDVNSKKKNHLFDLYEDTHKTINSLSNHQKKIVAPAIKTLENELGVSLNDSLQMLIFNIYKPFSNATLGFTTSENQSVSATNLGSGVSTLFALCLVVSFSENSKNPIIILIDEPELHLHSDLQKSLFTFLKEKPFQAILATHSHLCLDKKDVRNNFVLENDDSETIIVRTDGVELADLQFRLLGNSLDDLYVPEKILIVEGKFDRKILMKCFSLLGHKEVQIVEAFGKDGISSKADRYQLVLEDLSKDSWFSRFIYERLKIIIDGDVAETKVKTWSLKYKLDRKERIKHLNPTEKLQLEHYYPPNLIKKCVRDTKLSDGTNLVDKSSKEVVDIVLSDDKKSSGYKQSQNRVSKARFNKYIEENVTLKILQSVNGEELRKVVEWAIKNK